MYKLNNSSTIAWFFMIFWIYFRIWPGSDPENLTFGVKGHLHLLSIFFWVYMNKLDNSSTFPWFFMIFWFFLNFWPLWPQMTFDQPHEHNFDEGSLVGHHAWVSWNWPQMLRSWNFFSENRFLTLFDLIWPLTPCWSRDISGVAHCYFWPSLVKIGQKTSEIWPIMWMLKERKKEERKN